MAEARRIPARDYPEGFARYALELPMSPWLYTGGLENHPDLVDRIASTRPLWGNPGRVLRRVRNPLDVADSLKAAGIAVPEIRGGPQGVPRDGSWLVKPIASAGGRAISTWSAESDQPQEPSVWQERIEGVSLSAAYCSDASATTLLGVTRQLFGRPGRDFAYRGSIGPWPISDSASRRIIRIGVLLREEFGLLGLFGVDFILKDDVPWPVEVNPRYTASVEILELALGRSFLGEHRRAFHATDVRPSSPKFATESRFVAKGIVFAEGPSTFRDPRGRFLSLDPWIVPSIADVPEDGSTFRIGEPILTAFARGRSIGDASARLDRKVAAWNARLERKIESRSSE